MNIDIQKAGEAVKGGTLYGYIPHHLEVKEIPALSNFPYNVLFSTFGMKKGARVMGSALYDPDLATFKIEAESKYSMIYRNAYGGDSWLRIEFDEEEIKWNGEKFVNGESVGSAFGTGWKPFFVHLTLLGLQKGEKCMFDEVE